MSCRPYAGGRYCADTAQRGRHGKRHLSRLRRRGGNRDLQCGPRAGDRGSAELSAKAGRNGLWRRNLIHHRLRRQNAARRHSPLYRRPYRGSYIPVCSGGKRRQDHVGWCGLPPPGYRDHGAASGGLPSAVRQGYHYAEKRRTPARRCTGAYFTLSRISDGCTGSPDGRAAVQHRDHHVRGEHV